MEPVRTRLELLGRSPDEYDDVPYRPAHDGRYGLDSSATTEELGIPRATGR